MTDKESQKFADEAIESLKLGKPQEAMALARSGLSKFRKSGPCHFVLSIAHGQLKDTATSAEELRLGLEGYQHEADGFLEFSKILMSLNIFQDAYRVARKAQELNPDDPRIVTQIKKVQAAVEEENARHSAEMGFPLDDEVHSLPWVASFGKSWDVLGWVIACLAFPIFVSLVVALVAHLPTGLIYVLMIFYWPCALGAFFWTFADILDRRRNLLWIVPQVMLGCFSLSFVSLPLYLIFGRNESSDASSD